MIDYYRLELDWRGHLVGLFGTADQREGVNAVLGKCPPQ